MPGKLPFRFFLVGRLSSSKWRHRVNWSLVLLFLLMSIWGEMDFGGFVPRNYSLHLRMILELQSFGFKFFSACRSDSMLACYSCMRVASCVLSWQRHLALSIGLNFLIWLLLKPKFIPHPGDIFWRFWKSFDGFMVVD